MAEPTHPANARHGDNWWLEDIALSLQQGAGGANASIGTNGTTAPTSSTEVGGIYNSTPQAAVSGALTPIALDAFGNVKTNEQDMPTPVTGTISVVDSGSTSTAGLNGQNLITGTATVGSTVSAAFSGENSVSVLLTGNFIGTYVIERSIDNGTTWSAASALTAGSPASSFTAASAGSANALLHFNAASATAARVRVTTYTSGTLSIKIMPGTGVFPLSMISSMLGQYNSTAPTVTSGASNALQIDSAANLKVNEATRLDQVNDAVTAYPFGHSFTNITTATTTTAKSGAGVLHALTCNTPVASASITMYDNTAGSGTKLRTVTLPATLLAEGIYGVIVDEAFTTGLTAVTVGTADWTLTWR